MVARLLKQWIYVVVTSFQQNNTRDSLFRKAKNESLSLILLILLSALLMIADTHFRALVVVRNIVAMVVMPIRLVVDYPFRLVVAIETLLSSKNALIAENIKLNYQQTLLEAELQRLIAIQQENLQLKQLLLTSSRAKTTAMAAKILAIDVSSNRQLIIIDKGTRDGAYVDQPVLDAKGVLGQLIDVSYMTSTVLMISDAQCAVPVMNARTGERGIVVGTNDIASLSLINVPYTSLTHTGDLLVTSGFGRLYPEGYPVGRVKSVELNSGDSFMTIDVTPIALLNKDRLALLIWPGKKHFELTKQIAKRLSYKEDS